MMEDKKNLKGELAKGAEEKEKNQDSEAERGKKAINASKIANGDNPASPDVKQEEKNDASVWRSEG